MADIRYTIGRMQIDKDRIRNAQDLRLCGHRFVVEKTGR